MVRHNISELRRGRSHIGLAREKPPTRLPGRFLLTAIAVPCALQVASASDLGENAAGSDATLSCPDGRLISISGSTCSGQTLGASFVQGLSHLERLVWSSVDEKILEEHSHTQPTKDDHRGNYPGPGVSHSQNMQGLSLVDGRAVPDVFNGVIGEEEEEEDTDDKSGNNGENDDGEDKIDNTDNSGSGSGIRVQNVDNISLATAASDVGFGENTDKHDATDRRGGVSTPGSSTASRKPDNPGGVFGAMVKLMAKVNGPRIDASGISDAMGSAARLAEASSAAVNRWLLEVQTHTKAVGAGVVNKYQTAGISTIIPIFMSFVFVSIFLVVLASALTFSSEAPDIRNAVDTGYMAPFSPQSKQRSPIPPLHLPLGKTPSNALPPSQLETSGSLLPRSSSELIGPPKTGSARGNRAPELDPVEAALGDEKSATLSPDLVVPDNCECALLMPIKDIRPGSYHITDMVGSEVLHVSPKGPKRRLALMSAAGDILASCCASRPSAPPGTPGSAEFHLFRADGEYFALLSRGTDQERYTLSTVRGTQMSLWGTFDQHSVNVTGDGGKLLATTEKCPADFDPDGEYFRLRVASKMDVGLVLCSILCIFHLGEGQL